MDKRQAVEFLEYLRQDRNLERTIYGDALNVAIEALKAQLSKEGTTSDLIDRQAALDIFDDYNVSVENGELEAYSRDRKRLCELPTIQPEPHEGTWVYGEDSTADCVDGYRCSQCGFFVPWDYNHKLIDYINDYAYCPNCGAKMKGEQDGH